jgi:hypothetical protein
MTDDRIFALGCLRLLIVAAVVLALLWLVTR